MPVPPKAALLLALPLLSALPAQASSDDAWEAFRQQTETACRALVDLPGDLLIEVNPFGSERFGVALITLTISTGVERMACVMDKQTGAAELTAPFTAP